MPKSPHDRTQQRRRRALAGALAWVAGSACLAGCERTQLSDGLPNTLDCSACHGSPGNPAPPKALNGSTSTNELGVGAHDSHVLGTSTAGPVACVECHPQPADMITHPDINLSPAEMVFGPLATTDGAEPVWDRADAKCLNTYCHGATLSGAERRPAPRWTSVDGTQRRCSSCHGAPPPDPHPSEGACESCHGDVAGPGSSIKNPARHVDGVVDFGSASTSLFRSGSASKRRLALAAWRARAEVFKW